MKSVVGVVFPVLSEHIERIFNEGRTVFVKYTKFNRLQRDSKIVFYVSKEKRLIGEGTIEKIEVANPKEIWPPYRKQIFLNESEFEQYVSKSPVDGTNRKMVEITLFTLKNLKKYKKSRPWLFSVTPAGRYLTKEEYDRIK